MSLKKIKSTLDTELYAQITDVVIKNENSSVYLLNNVPLTNEELNNLSFFINPKIVPITQDKEVLGNADSVNTRGFYTIEIYSKNGDGTGDSLTMEERLNALFRFKVFSGVVCENSNVLTPFPEGAWYVTIWRVTVREWG